ncbi:MAG TPA: PfkB family carbohydrate kinase [Thermoanaerobaculia bacterium]|nr:PfkB family carbohydrate kinase [Thermoanaerobaculia bacterium]
MKTAIAAPELERLLELVQRFNDQPVLMLVDLVADRFISGSPKRISREAPVLILRFESELVTPGGGANAVANVAALGGTPLPLGVVGDDASGRALLSDLERRGVSTAGILTRPGYQTPTKTRILGGGRHAIKQQIVRYDIEEAQPLAAAESEELARRMRSWSGRAGVCVMSDYGYGTVLPELLPAVREALNEPAMVVADSRFQLERFHGVDAVTPNEEETEILLGEPLGEDAEQVAIQGREILSQLAARAVLITRGSHGMNLVSADAAVEIPVHGTDQVADVTGAGDTVIGTFALALAAGADPLEAALLANYAGGVVVMKTGTATLTRDELLGAIRSDQRLIKELRWAKS